MPTPSEHAYTRVVFDGKPVNARTRDALLFAQALWRKRGKHRKSIRLAKGSYQQASDTSGTTHSGGGAVDVRTKGVGLTDEETKELSIALKDAGFACWIRDDRDGFDPHIHALACSDREMSASAQRQVVSFDLGRNALVSNLKDRNPYRPSPKLRFNYSTGKPVPRK
jgi:hypothetical protein